MPTDQQYAEDESRKWRELDAEINQSIQGWKNAEGNGTYHLDGQKDFWHIYYERFLDDDFWVEYSTKFYELTLARGSFSVKNGVRAIAIGLREVKGNLFVCRGGFLDAPNLERVGGRLVIEDGAEANLGIGELMAERVKTMNGLGNVYGDGKYPKPFAGQFKAALDK